MKHVFLSSQFRYAAKSISQKLGNKVKEPAVYITTSFMYKSEVQDWQVKNREGLVKAGFNLVDYNIAGKSAEEINRDLSHYKIMCVEGGNNVYLLQESQKNNFGAFVKKRIEAGMVYISSSAGSIVAGPDIAYADRPGKSAKDYGLTSTSGFGVVNFVIMPHWGDLSKKEDYMNYKIPNAYKENYPYIPLTDQQYIEVQDDWMNIVDVTRKEHATHEPC